MNLTKKKKKRKEKIFQFVTLRKVIFDKSDVSFGSGCVCIPTTMFFFEISLELHNVCYFSGFWVSINS